jgi:hypothetical protein
MPPDPPRLVRCLRCGCEIPWHWLLCDGCKRDVARSIAQAWQDFQGGAFFDDGAIRNLWEDEALLWRALQAEGTWW